MRSFGTADGGMLLRLVRRAVAGGGATATCEGLIDLEMCQLDAWTDGWICANSALAFSTFPALFATPENLKSLKLIRTERLCICASRNAVMLWSADS